MQPHPLNGKVVIRCLVQPHSPRKGSVDCFAVAENSGRKKPELYTKSTSKILRKPIECISNIYRQTPETSACIRVVSIDVRFMLSSIENISPNFRTIIEQLSEIYRLFFFFFFPFFCLLPGCSVREAYIRLRGRLGQDVVSTHKRVVGGRPW